MCRSIALTFLMMVTLSAGAATKDSGSTTLKDVQPVGVTDKKHKHQQYDLSFVSSTGKDYTCRTGEKTSVKATDFVVGSNVNYHVDGNKGKVKTSAGKQVSCMIVRVANVPAAPK
jgi:gentisate 1,2-dioxygenase